MTDIIELSPECRERFLDHASFPELADQQISLGGLSTLRGLHRIRRQFHGRMMLSFALAGGSYYTVGAYQGHWQAGHALFVPPDTPFALDLDNGSFRQSAWLILEQSPYWNPLLSLPACFLWEDGPSFARVLEDLYRERYALNSQRLRLSLLTQCREYLLRLTRPQPARDPLLETLLLEIDSQLGADWSIRALVNRTGLSSAQLHRRFLAHCGQAPMSYISQLRMQRATLLLHTSNLSVASIAEQVGFHNPFYFSTVFKQHHGLSPQAWRTMQQTRDRLASQSAPGSPIIG